MIRSVLFIDNYLLKCFTIDAVVRETDKHISISIILLLLFAPHVLQFMVVMNFLS